MTEEDLKREREGQRQRACCETMRSAMEAGHDWESYSPCVHIIDGHAHCGHGLPPMTFCPWCGVEIGDRFKE